MYIPRLPFIRAFTQAVRSKNMEVIPVPCFTDNYAYLVLSEGSDFAIVVDPSEHSPVIDALKHHKKGVSAIFAVRSSGLLTPHLRMLITFLDGKLVAFRNNYSKTCSTIMEIT